MTTEAPPAGPPRDRRQRRRILTKKNVAIGIGLFVIAFLAVSVWFEYHAPRGDSYGRLYSSRTRLPELPERQPYTVVEGEEVSGRDGANPLLLEGLRREQFLGVEPGMLERQHGIDPDPPALGYSPGPDGAILGRGDPQKPAEIRITGGPEGVEIEKDQ